MPPVTPWENLLDRALEAQASDVHMHVSPNAGATVRARIDGVMVPWGELTAEVVGPALIRMKSSAELGTGASRLVGEGRIRHEGPKGPVDLRVTITPLVGGATKVALRLPAIATELPLSELGFSDANLERVEKLLSSPDGLVLATGPVGAGKSTTLMSALSVVGGADRAVVTVEDPVERLIAGADQIEVREIAGLTYEHILKSLLRMDLDVLLIGEIRDRATAQHAVQIAKAGRLVMSTLHSGSAVGALMRLVELSSLGSLEVAESVRGVISQRLVRRLHHVCEGRGCSACLWTGYSGRVPIHEVLVVNDDIREALIARATTKSLTHVARQGGMRTFSEDAHRWVAGGQTTAEEMERVLGRG